MDLQVKLDRDLDAAIQERVPVRMRGFRNTTLRLDQILRQWVKDTQEVEDDGPRLEQPTRRRIRR
jgi:hypothetical protein